MRKLALLLLILPAALAAQSLQTIAPQQCVWPARSPQAVRGPRLKAAGKRRQSNRLYNSFLLPRRHPYCPSALSV